MDLSPGGSSLDLTGLPESAVGTLKLRNAWHHHVFHVQVDNHIAVVGRWATESSCYRECWLSGAIFVIDGYGVWGLVIHSKAQSFSLSSVVGGVWGG